MATPITFEIDAVTGGYQALITAGGTPQVVTDIYPDEDTVVQALAYAIYTAGRFDLSQWDVGSFSTP